MDDDINQIDLEPRALNEAEHPAHLLAPGPARPFLDLLAPMIRDMGYGLVRIRMTGEAGAPVLQIMAEEEDGTLAIEHCEKISVAVSAILDVEDPIRGEYTLEVSSPGMARPLTRAQDFETWVEHEAKLELHMPVDGQRRFRGIVKGYENDEALMEVPLVVFGEPQILGFKLADISEARLVPDEDYFKTALKGKSKSGK
jgi:ribosome maturation factor RimP